MEVLGLEFLRIRIVRLVPSGSDGIGPPPTSHP
jgi:hypothetical protein